MTKLKPFDRGASCKKCNGRSVGIKWVPAQRAETSTLSGLRTLESPEHLQRDCLECGYSWQEDIADPFATPTT